MLNIFHRSAEFVQKHKRHHHFALATLALILAGAGTYIYRHEIAHAATYTFAQTDWRGGISTATSTHTSNQSNWTQYFATTTGVTAGVGVSLATTAKTSMDDGVGLSAKTDYTTGTNPRDVAISADGTSVYVANNSSDTVSMYSRNTSTGTLSAKTDYTTGTSPRGVAISADGTSVYVTNYNSDTVSMYSRNTSTGTLSAKTDYTTGT
ncbi:MAG: beta-propeller fold lactonase family protein, partial [Candidatus Yonathbacteria bacterium]|nr:beta-propeller fold lactonase family protein [Candidatus Yonathbacteria bacterium]